MLTNRGHLIGAAVFALGVGLLRAAVLLRRGTETMGRAIHCGDYTCEDDHG